MSRLSRKQMKRNEMAETVGSVVDYTRHHTRMLLWAVIGVIALGVAVGTLLVWRGQRGAAATAALAAAMTVEDDEAMARERFQEVVDRFPGSGAAEVARLYLAGFAAASADPARARGLWEAAAEEGGDSALGQQARLNLWELEREQGRHDELVSEIRTLLDDDKPPLSKDQLLYQLALTLEAGGNDVEARDTYLRLVEEHPQSVFRGIAQQRADRLGTDVTG
jgi:tetratricopeptide (TPR) repeat protein